MTSRTITDKRKKQCRHQWTPEEIALLGTMTDKKVAEIIGIPLRSVKYQRIDVQGIKAYQTWTEYEKSLVGTMPDVVLAKKIGRSPQAVKHKRVEMNLPSIRPEIQKGGRYWKWSPEAIALLGTMPDCDLAEILGCTTAVVTYQRKRVQGIPAFLAPWTDAEIELLGTMPDRMLAAVINRTRLAIQSKRKALGIPPAPVTTLWTEDVYNRMGIVPDAELAKELGVQPKTVRRHRLKAGIYSTDECPKGQEDNKVVESYVITDNTVQEKYSLLRTITKEGITYRSLSEQVSFPSTLPEHINALITLGFVTITNQNPLTVKRLRSAGEFLKSYLDHPMSK